MPDQPTQETTQGLALGSANQALMQRLIAEKRQLKHVFRYTSIPFRMHMECDDLTPCKAHADDAAYDLHSRQNLTIYPGKVALVPTGLYLELPVGYEAQVRPRSGLALKHSITVLNSPGTVDAGYRGEVGVVLFNAGDTMFTIERGDRIAQMVIQSLPSVELVRAEQLSETERGAGGFGSSGGFFNSLRRPDIRRSTGSFGSTNVKLAGTEKVDK
jgi:dUTP pyrophosphatase